MAAVTDQEKQLPADPVDSDSDSQGALAVDEAAISKEPAAAELKSSSSCEEAVVRSLETAADAAAAAAADEDDVDVDGDADDGHSKGNSQHLDEKNVEQQKQQQHDKQEEEEDDDEEGLVVVEDEDGDEQLNVDGQSDGESKAKFSAVKRGGRGDEPSATPEKQPKLEDSAACEEPKSEGEGGEVAA